MKEAIASMFRSSTGAWDLSRVALAAMAVAYIAQSGYALWRGQHFDWQAFGVGAGAITAGSGAGVWMHAKDRQ